jgi:sugar/nucleoside kinase (ribokinase family)
MSEAQYDVTGIGNAIVDVLAATTDAEIVANGIAKGAMTLIDEYRARQLYEKMKRPELTSGGSAANTIAGIASMGGRGAFLGRVKKDQLGEAFAADLKRLGVRFDTKMPHTGPATAQSLIFITPDGQRSMNTFLGACVELSRSDIDEKLIRGSAVTYFEGYLWDPPHAKAAISEALSIAHASKRLTAYTLSDPFCVGRYREEFRVLCEKDVDIFFANEKEILSLYEVDDFDAALQAVKATGKIAALTRSERGSVIVKGSEVHIIEAEPTKVVDTTGAGDLYAAGFLFGLTRGLPLSVCGRMGSVAAAEVISHIGPRPKASLKALFTQKKLI